MDYRLTAKEEWYFRKRGLDFEDMERLFLESVGSGYVEPKYCIRRMKQLVSDMPVLRIDNEGRCSCKGLLLCETISRRIEKDGDIVSYYLSARDIKPLRRKGISNQGIESLFHKALKKGYIEPETLVRSMIGLTKHIKTKRKLGHVESIIGLWLFVPDKLRNNLTIEKSCSKMNRETK